MPSELYWPQDPGKNRELRVLNKAWKKAVEEDVEPLRDLHENHEATKQEMITRAQTRRRFLRDCLEKLLGELSLFERP